MKAIAVVQPGRVEIVELDRPKPGPYQAVVKNEVAALCNATDGKLVSGHFPGVDTYPLILGHEGAGIVQEVGPKVRNFKSGDRVIGGLLFEFSDTKYASGWGGFCEYTLANDHDAMVEAGVADAAHGWFECYEIQRTVEDDIPAEEAALLCTWREVYGGIGDFQMRPKDDLLVFGGGPVGLSFVKFCRLLGTGWIGLVDPIESKRKRALLMGADAAFAPDTVELKELTKRRGKPMDIVVDAVGSEPILNTALPLIKMGGSIGVYGVIGAKQITIQKGAGPYNFNLFVHQWPTRWREREAQAPLCKWIREGKLKASEFVTHRFPVGKINDALAAVKTGEVVKVLLKYQ
jgi:threonine dehydrogenase-like Zn-dependent dehydrogenase